MFAVHWALFVVSAMWWARSVDLRDRPMAFLCGLSALLNLVACWQS